MGYYMWFWAFFCAGCSVYDEGQTVGEWAPWAECQCGAVASVWSKAMGRAVGEEG